MNTVNVSQPILDAEKTYMSLRRLLAGIALALPIVLVGGGLFLKAIPILPQLSAYYFTAMGDLFVGMLCIIGVGLIAYKGFTDAEDVALNIGGVLICLVAIFHMNLNTAISCITRKEGANAAEYLLRSIELGAPSWLHFTCAALFYGALGYVMIFCSHASLEALQAPDSVILRYRRLYTSLGSGFVLSVIFSFAVYMATSKGCENLWILIAEVTGLLCFSAFWIVKTIEISSSEADKKRAQISRKKPQPRIRDLW